MFKFSSVLLNMFINLLNLFSVPATITGSSAKFTSVTKAFDRVNWVKMFEIMKKLHIDWRDRRWLQDLYMRQEAVVQTVGGDSDPGVIGRGVRQGCPISPLLFSIYAEVMMIEALEDMEEEVSVGLFVCLFVFNGTSAQKGYFMPFSALCHSVSVGGQLVSDVRFA